MNLRDSLSNRWQASTSFNFQRYTTMKKILAGATGALALVAINAQAALPTGVDTAFTDLQTDFTTVAGYATTAAIAVAVAFKVISMVKKGVGRV